jgi:aminomethyltransferase
MTAPDGLRPTPFSSRLPNDIEEWIDVCGFAVPLFIGDPDSEYRAVREGAGALEYSVLHQWEISGPEATATVDAVVTRNVATLPTGRLVYSVVVDDDGRMVDDVTVSRLSENHLIVIGGNDQTEARLRAAAPAGTLVIDRRDERAVLALQGPRSREVLRQLTSADVSNEALPYYGLLTDITVAGVPARVARVGFTAELGYEITVPIEHALTLWDAVISSNVGVTPFSAGTLMTARTEAGLVMGEIDYDHTMSPFECRLGWTVDFDKPGLANVDALAARKVDATRSTVTVMIDGEPDGLEAATLELDGVIVGTIPMPLPSPFLDGATISLALIDRSAAAVGTELIVRGDNRVTSGRVVATPVYDPERLKVRS